MAIPFLQQTAAGSLIAGTEEEYVDLACDASRIQPVAESLQPEGLFRDQQTVRALDDFLLSLPLV